MKIWYHWILNCLKHNVLQYLTLAFVQSVYAEQLITTALGRNVVLFRLIGVMILIPPPKTKTASTFKAE